MWTHMPLVVVAVMLGGCATPPPSVLAPVPVRCKEPTPDRPSMPTDSLALDAPLDTKARSMAAEIELRDGYELRLRTALEACR